jgi:hypothetical protein
MFLSPVLLICLAPPAPDMAEPAVYTIRQRSFRVPVSVETRRGEVDQITLFVSIDQGKTWREAGVIGPDEDAFRYRAAADGVYWFAVQIQLKNGMKEPADMRMLQPELKVSVELPKKPEWQAAVAELDDEVKYLRSEVQRLKDRLAVLERMLKERQ